MTLNEELGTVLEAFMNRVAHPRGRALSFMARWSVTVSQAILLNHALRAPGSTPTQLAAKMNLSLSSVSQMTERLVKLGLLQRSDDPGDRRRKTLDSTPRAKRFLRELRAVRSREFAAGAALLSSATQQELVSLLSRVLEELRSKDAPSKPPVPR